MWLWMFLPFSNITHDAFIVDVKVNVLTNYKNNRNIIE